MVQTTEEKNAKRRAKYAADKKEREAKEAQEQAKLEKEARKKELKRLQNQRAYVKRKMKNAAATEAAANEVATNHQEPASVQELRNKINMKINKHAGNVQDMAALNAPADDARATEKASLDILSAEIKVLIDLAKKELDNDNEEE